MTYTQPTCNHLHDDGHHCNSVAAKDQRYCGYHLRHRARLMRMAKARARAERFDINLPPLESMHAVQSALSQVGEALAADMIDLKRADRLIRVLTVSSRNLLKADKWPAASPYHSDQPGPALDFAAEYGLPQDLNLDLAPEVAFPPPLEPTSSDLSSRAVGEGSAFPSSADNRPLTTDNLSAPPDMPFSGNYCGDHHSRECECLRIRADHPVTPEMVEVVEITQTYGSDVAAARSKQLERNSERRRLNHNRKRFAAIALEHNLRRAAERMAELKLAERANEEAGCRTPASVAGVGVVPDAAKKPPASAETPAKAGDKSTLGATG